MIEGRMIKMARRDRAVPAVRVGSVVRARRPTSACESGELGVCYAVASLGGRPAYSFIFERGDYAAFSPGRVAQVLELIGACENAVDYQYNGLVRLVFDYRHGLFDAAFGQEVAAYRGES
jgi:hypothetical protein